MKKKESEREKNRWNDGIKEKAQKREAGGNGKETVSFLD